MVIDTASPQVPTEPNDGRAGGLFTPHSSHLTPHGATRIVDSKKAASVNPLKMSAPLGACYAFLGMNSCMPLMHGSQGCTSFGLVLLVRHFREAIPLQTTAMNEVTTILGGLENIEKSLLNIKKRANPALIGIASTGLTETKGDDVTGYLKLIREKHTAALAGTEVVYVSTPDYVGAFEDGWRDAVTALVRQFARPADTLERVNLLPGAHLTPGDVDELKEIIAAFDLEATVLPDLSLSLDGHIAEDFTPTSLGGTSIGDARLLGSAMLTLAIGEHMRKPAAEIEQASGVPYVVFERATGLAATDALMAKLAQVSGRPVPAKYRRQRSQLQDAMLDAHFFLSGVKVAIGAEPDLLYAVSSLLAELGAETAVAVTTTHNPVLENLPCTEVRVGDLEDLEQGAKAHGCELLITHAHGRQAASRLGIPFHRMGIPTFDRLGAGHKLSVGYRGTRDLLFELGNLMLAVEHHHGPDDWPLPPQSIAAARGESATV